MSAACVTPAAPSSNSVTFRVSNTATDSRNIIRDYGLQVDTGNAAIDSEIDPGETIVVARPPGVGNTLGGTARENQLNFAGLRHRSGGQERSAPL